MMKKIKGIVLLIMAMLLLVPISAFALGTAELSAADVVGVPGEAVNVEVKLAKNTGISNIAFLLKYDNSMFTNSAVDNKVIVGELAKRFQMTTANKDYKDSANTCCYLSAVNSDTDDNNKNDGILLAIPLSIKRETKLGRYPLTLTVDTKKYLTGITENEATLTVLPGSITVTPGKVASMTVKTQPQLAYVDRKELNLSKLVVTVNYEASIASEDIAYADFQSRGLATSIANNEVLTTSQTNTPIIISYAGKSIATDNLSVVAKAVCGISIVAHPTKMDYKVGDTLELAGMEATLTSNDGSIAGSIFWPDGFAANKIALSIDGTDVAQPPTLTLAQNGKTIKATYDGSATIFAETAPLAVSEKSITAIAITTQPKTAYIEGNAPDLSAMRVTLTYDTGAPDTEVQYAALSGKGVTVTLGGAALPEKLARTDDAKTIKLAIGTVEAQTGALTVAAKKVASIAVATQPTQLSYIEGSATQGKLALAGLAVTLTYDNGDTKSVTFGETDFPITASPANGSDMTVSSHHGQPVTLTYSGTNHAGVAPTCNTSNLTVVAKAVEGIAVTTQPTKTSYVEGQTLDLAGLAATLTYNDASTESVALADFAKKAITAAPAAGTTLAVVHNSKPITLTCNGKTAETHALTVIPKAVVDIKVKTNPTKLAYVVNETFDLTGLEVTLSYNDETSV
ncbi:MAG: hypothetical protein RR893_12235, partial [Clostridia bacterium]